MIGLNVALENTLAGAVEFVSVAPNGIAAFDIAGIEETLEIGIVSQILFIVAMRDDVALIAHYAVIKVGGIQA